MAPGLQREADENFYIVREPVRRVKLPAPPNLLTITQREAKAWCATWLSAFLGPFPGYADPSKKPSWYPIEWSPKRNKDKNKSDCIKIIAAMYKEYEGIDVDVPNSDAIRAESASSGSQVPPVGATAQPAPCNEGGVTPSDTQHTEQQVSDTQQHSEQQHQVQSAYSSNHQDYVAINVAVPTSSPWGPSYEDLDAASTSSCPVANQPLATWQQPPPPPPTESYYQHPTTSAVPDYWTDSVPMLAPRPSPASHTMTYWPRAPAPLPEPPGTAQEELPCLQTDISQLPPDSQPSPQPQREQQPIDTAASKNKGSKRKTTLKQDVVARKLRKRL